MRINLDEKVRKIPAYPKSASYGFSGNLLRLASNENPYPPSPKVITGIIEALLHLNRYPQGDSDLKEALSYHLDVKPENIAIGCGSNEIIEVVLRISKMESKDKVIVPYPSFAFYEIAASIYGYEVIRVPLNDLSIDLEGIIRMADSRTRLIFLCNPNNPTGKIVKKDEFEWFLDNLPKDVILVVDEAYSDFVESTDFSPSYKYIEDYPVVTLRTFSKAYALAGLRIGYGITHHEMAGILERARQPFSVNMLAIIAASKALEDRTYVESHVRKIVAEKKRIYERLEEKGIEFVQSETNFLLIKIGENAEEVAKRLYNEGILVRWMGPMGLPEFIRLTVGKGEENDIFLSTLFRLLGKE